MLYFLLVLINRKPSLLLSYILQALSISEGSFYQIILLFSRQVVFSYYWIHIYLNIIFKSIFLKNTYTIKEIFHKMFLPDG